MFLLHGNNNFLIQYLRKQKQPFKGHLFCCCSLWVCLNLMQFIICLATPENSKFNLNIYEAFITALTQTLKLVRNSFSVKAFSMWKPVNSYSLTNSHSFGRI